MSERTIVGYVPARADNPAWISVHKMEGEDAVMHHIPLDGTQHWVPTDAECPCVPFLSVYPGTALPMMVHNSQPR